MMARDRRYGKSTTKTRVGIATAVLVGGAVAAAAVVASHGAVPTATSAAYASRSGNEGTVISSAMLKSSQPVMAFTSSTVSAGPYSVQAGP